MEASALVDRKTDPSSEEENRDGSSEPFPSVHSSITSFSFPCQIQVRSDLSIRDPSVDFAVRERTIHKPKNILLNGP